MAKLSSPLFSRSAKGRFGDSMVYSTWRGIAYAKVWRRSASSPTLRQACYRRVVRVVNHEWGKLTPEERGAWEAFAARQRKRNPGNSFFLSYATVALDAGLPVPKRPPRSRVPQRLRLKAVREADGCSVNLCWSRVSRPGALIDVWLQVSKPSRKAYAHNFHHLVYVPAEQGKVLVKGLTPALSCHLSARVILPDSNRSHFVQASV